jgi:hypothetical protein
MGRNHSQDQMIHGNKRFRTTCQSEKNRDIITNRWNTTTELSTQHIDLRLLLRESFSELHNRTFPQADIRISKLEMLPITSAPTKLWTPLTYMLPLRILHIVPPQSPRDNDADLEHRHLLA